MKPIVLGIDLAKEGADFSMVTMPQSEYEALRKDAERYRFLRDSGNAFPLCFISQRVHDGRVVVQFQGETADRNIDALMAERGPQTRLPTEEK